MRSSTGGWAISGVGIGGTTATTAAKDLTLTATATTGPVKGVESPSPPKVLTLQNSAHEEKCHDCIVAGVSDIFNGPDDRTESDGYL